MKGEDEVPSSTVTDGRERVGRRRGRVTVEDGTCLGHVRARGQEGHEIKGGRKGMAPSGRRQEAFEKPSSAGGPLATH